MKLSSPIYLLKSQAKALKKAKNIPMAEALNLIAQKEGIASWSLLCSKNSLVFPQTYSEIRQFLNNGDLVIVAARPGHGKTSFTAGLFIQVIHEEKAKNYYFTLDENLDDVEKRLNVYDPQNKRNDHLFELDYSNNINADYIISKVQGSICEGAVIVIDYLQRLDEKRISPPVQEQVKKLHDFAKTKKCIIIFLCQIAREIECQSNKRPTLDDIRLPNPLNLKLINKIFFLFREQQGGQKVETSVLAGVTEHKFMINWDHDQCKFY